MNDAEKLELWAREHGDEVLRLMVKHKIDFWGSVASEQFATAHAPTLNGQKMKVGEVGQHANTYPTLSQLRAYDQLIDMCNAPGSMLQNVKIRSWQGDNCVAVSFAVPGGKLISLYHKC